MQTKQAGILVKWKQLASYERFVLKVQRYHGKQAAETTLYIAQWWMDTYKEKPKVDGAASVEVVYF